MTQFNINASNIKCGGCAENIKNGLSEMPGVESVEVNVDSGEVAVTVNNLEQSAIENKLNELGYPAK